MSLSERHEHVGELFKRAAGLPEAEREAFRRDECRDDQSLLNEMLELLAADAESGPIGSSSRPALRMSFFGHQREQPQPPMTGIEPGRVIDDFILITPIGQGGMGQVWEAEQVSLNRRVALKLVRPDRVNEHTLDLFSREARAGGRLSHPGIVSVHGHGEAEGVAWISMELVEGSWTLKDFIEESARLGELPEGYYRRVVELVAALADALQAAHEANVIHRDLKPANVLITPDEHPKITDFGLAKIVDETALSVTGDFAGTYAYMSPEQVTAKRMGLDHRTDVFSLGVLLYELLALRRPFEGDTTAQVAQQIVTEDPIDLNRLRSRIPVDLAVIAGKCLEKSPDRRYQTMEAVAADIRRHLEDKPIHARPPSAAQRATKWVRRHPTPSVALGVSIVALAVISVLLVKNIDANKTIAKERTQLRDEIESVGRLSDQKDLDDLIVEADRLWPAHRENIKKYEDWIQRADTLVARLPLHRATLARLQAQALEPTDDERRVDRETHSLYNEWRSVEAEWRAKYTALLARLDGVTADPVEEPDWSKYPDDLKGLLDVASPLVDPFRIQFGSEWLGLRLCQKAEGKMDSAEVEAEVSFMMAQALFSLGRDEAARESLRIFIDVIEGRGSQEADRLAELIDAATATDALVSARVEVESLDRRRRELDSQISVRRDWRFSSTEPRGRWWISQQATLIKGLEALLDEELGLLGNGISPKQGWGMARRLAAARHLEEKMMLGADHQVRWRDAKPSIAKAYPGLDLSEHEHMGLVPIGPDPVSGLWEFWHVPSGEEPLRGEDSKLIVTEESGIVLVLLPGGKFLMGAGADSGKPNYDPIAARDASPVHEVLLSPFFLSKFEMTQGQWLRLTGRNPARYQGAMAVYLDHVPDLRHPVENISWLDCRKLLPRAGLTMPSEAQWEYGARARSDTRWWTGGERDSLAEKNAVNLADQAARAGNADWTTIKDWPELNDGRTVHAPVGTYEANAFGLHEVHGNVWEWCLDGYSVEAYEKSARKDPVFPYSAKPNRVDRGGSFKWTASDASSANRDNGSPSNAGSDLGVRPAIWVVTPE